MDTPVNPDQQNQAPPGGGPVRIKIRLNNKPKSSAESSPGSTPAADTPIASGPPPPTDRSSIAPQPTTSMPAYVLDSQGRAVLATSAAAAPPPAKKARNLDFTPSPPASPSGASAALPPSQPPASTSSAASLHPAQMPSHISTVGGPLPGLQSIPVPSAQHQAPTASTSQHYPPPAFHPPAPPPPASIGSYRSSPAPYLGGGGSSMGGGSDRGESPDPSTGRAYVDVPPEVLEGLTGRALVEKKRKWRKKEGVAGPGKNWRKGLKKGEIKPEAIPAVLSPHAGTASPSLPPPSLPLSRPPPQTGTSQPSTTQTFSRPVAPPPKYSTSTYLIPDPLLSRGPYKTLRPRHWGLGRRSIKGVGGGTWGVVNWMGEEEVGSPSLRDRAGMIGGGGAGSGGVREREREKEREYQPRQTSTAEGIKSEAYLAGLRAATALAGTPPAGLASPAPQAASDVSQPTTTGDVKMEG